MPPLRQEGAAAQMSARAHAYTVASFGRAYSVGKTLTWQLIRDEKLRAVRVGRRVLILSQDAEAWAASLPATTETVQAKA